MRCHHGVLAAPEIVGYRVLFEETGMNPLYVHPLELLWRLVLAIVSGAAIGLNRWIHHKPAGIGTHALVALGAAIATTAALRMPGGDTASASRVMQGLVTGVGFIGAGVIMRESQNDQVHGLTTAASIWICAVLGIACALCDFVTVSIGLVLVLLVLVVSKPLEFALEKVFHHKNQNGTRS
jgi:putative Mg2+ transporter-C (MgtC) family protein